VMREGRIAGEVSGDEMTEHNVALLATSDVAPGKGEGGNR
jgi:ribose transport system ATP-binding protein